MDFVDLGPAMAESATRSRIDALEREMADLRRRLLEAEKRASEAFEAGRRDAESRARNRPGDGDMGG